MKARVILIFWGVLVVVLTFTYPNWRPFLTGETGRGFFPGLSEAENDVFQLLSAEQRAVYRQMLSEDAVMAVAMVRAALQPNTTVPLEQQALPPMLAPTEIAYGDFIALDAIRWASGNFILYREADAAKLLRLENFRSAPGPDLRVLLAVAPPTDEDGIIMSENLGDLGIERTVSGCWTPQGQHRQSEFRAGAGGGTWDNFPWSSSIALCTTC